MKNKNDDQTVPNEKTEEVISEEQRKIQELQLLLNASLEREKRVLADYQNLQRRSQTERLAFIKMANKDFCQVLLQPLEHLSMAAANLKDRGLDMVVEQFWKELRDFGLEEIEVLAKKFDLETMEVVDKKGDGEKVVEVVRKGYSLNGEVIQHAQVILA
ncbi:MAG: Protein GrpE [Candidatus Pacebacteria bacterium GW2011_GWF2_38_9]|nr:MAG: heat shock protein GrpE, molecular chaperone GrpE [candidate division TM6 bacterium GW2011_GWF2_28_16]KKQ09135.1 MAG: Protein GrpE [Candidatus Pacebacteria bacterium GW2011_GWF1_36_5]KKQ88513.1 MAG: Protein GrpE [Candidatus Pacebacteria bacterium GW2011_GWF2_38_9]HAZ73352.1 nucleotide exchange factor GrpE [Candidatus Paceibacterota bacterium]